MERICGNCQLYNASKGECRIVVIIEDERANLPVDPTDACFFEEEYFDPIKKQKTTLVNDIQQIRMWTEDKDGKPTNGDGVVKIEYPKNLFD